MAAIIEYILRILPALIVAGLTFVFIKPGRHLRVILYIAIFVLMRDAMTPLELWRFGSADGMFWMRLKPDPVFLTMFGLSSLSMVGGLYLFDRENRPALVWLRRPAVGMIVGLIGALIVVSPALLVRNDLPAPDATLFPFILIFALFGNLLEEVLFRGYALACFKERGFNGTKAAIASGICFAFCHMYLATTVSAAGWPLLLFTLWEGTIAGLIAVRFGIIPATLTHGGAIFLISSGLIL